MPAGPSWPRPKLTFAVALIASLLLGCGLAVLLEFFNPKVAREDELVLEQRLPILARIPRMRKNVVNRYLTGTAAAPGLRLEGLPRPAGGAHHRRPGRGPPAVDPDHQRVTR